MRFLASGLATWLLLAAWTPREVPGQDVPRFLNARQHGLPAAYEIYCFHAGPLTEEDLSLQQQVSDLALSHANVLFMPMDVERDPDLTHCSPAVREAWLFRSEPSRPRYAVFAPNGAELYAGDDPPIPVSALVRSPARDRLAAELASDCAGVFVFVPGDDEVANAAGEKILASLVQEINAANSTDADSHPGRAAWFRVDARDLAETWFVRTLRLLSDETQSISSQPLVSLVFGRARALPAVAGAQISRDRLRADWRSLMAVDDGQPHEESGGLDLPIQRDWDLGFGPHASSSGGAPRRDAMIQRAAAESELIRESPRRPTDQQRVEPLPLSLSLVSVCVATGLIALLWLMYVIIRPS